MPVAQLPFDVVDEIARCADTRDLYSLCRTNTLFCTSAQRLIYRHISINSSSKAVCCLTTLSRNKELALHVRSFSIRLDPATIVLRPFVRAHAEALSSMLNLSSLDINLPSSASQALLVPDSSIYHRLTHFSCNFPFNASVATFLSHTPALAELRLSVPLRPESSLSPVLSTHVLSHLAVFMGSCEDAIHIVPGRPLENVHLQGGELNENVLRALSQSRVSIQALEATGDSLTLSLLSSIASYLPHLRHLRMMTTYHSYEHRTVPYMEVAQVLASFSNLMTAQLEGIHWASWHKERVESKPSWRESSLETSDILVEDESVFAETLDNFEY